MEGRLEPGNLGEFAHSRLKGVLASELSTFADKNDVQGVLGISLLVAPNRVRVCDVALLRRETPTHHPISTPPLLCTEVLSSEDKLDQVERVLRDYVTMGVEHIWLLDPYRRAAYNFDRNGLRPSGPELTVAGTTIQIHAQSLFDQIGH